LKDFLKEKNLIDEASDIPYYKINALVKNGKLSAQEIQTYLDKKDSWRLSP
jgi:phosphoribosyl-ATP pyrophosphohydrolase